MFLDYLIMLSDSLSLGLSLLHFIPHFHNQHTLYYQMTYLSGLVTFCMIPWCSITITSDTLSQR
jgi:hypothetical protein